MLNKYFGNRFREAKSSERAEAMPAAIITAIVSSILLLSVAGIISVVLNLKSGSEANVSLTSVASNVDVSLRSDVAAASYITASANLVQPVAGQMINQSSLAITGVNLNIPESTGQCKLIKWMVSGTSVTRDLTIYSGTSKANDTVECDINSSVLAHRTKVFANNINIVAPFQFTNAAGRSLSFVLTNQTVSTINNTINQETAQQGGPLTQAQFNALNSLLNTDSFQAVFVNPSACAMNATPSNGVCPAPESASVTAAWNSLQIAKVSVNFKLSGNGQSISRDIAQNSSVPLYQTAAQAQAAVAAVSTYNQPTAPTPALSVSPIVLGSPYTVSWTTYGNCPDLMTVTYLLYENGQLINTTTSTSVSLTYTDSSTQYLNYTVQQMCTRGVMVVPSPMSTVVTAPVIPATPSLVINQQPSTTNAALNATLQATGTCLYNTSPRYTVTQTTTSYGTAGNVSNLTSVNMPINNGMQVVEGARYQYQVTSWCVSAYASSSNVNASTNTFTTVINAPAAPTFTSPVNGSTDVSTTAVLNYGPVSCAVGTTVAYSLNKTLAHTAINPPIQIETWGTATTFGTNNNQGYRVQYNATAECQGTAVTSAPSATASTNYVTHVNAPNSANAWNDGWTEVYWNAVSCAPTTTPQYRVIQTKADNNNVWFATGWTGGTQSGLPGSGYHTGGYPQWAHVEAYCLGADAVSTITGGTTTKWVENFTINFSTNMKWRRLEVFASCPYATNLSGNFSVYVAADGWNGTRYAQGIGTDDGNTIAASGPGGGGNSGWVTLNSNQNYGWMSQWNGTWGWGYWGQQGWASNINGTSMIGTYWNASAWGNYAYWWYGSCSSPYMTQTAKGSNWWGGGIRNLGNPYLTYNAVGGTSLTAAGVQSIQ